MLPKRFLKKERTGIWLIDVQEKLFPLVDHACEIKEKICFMLQSARLLGLPILVTEQYPEGLGKTLAQIKDYLPSGQLIYPKTTFSGYRDPEVQKAVQHTGADEWILMGIEAHICVLQTAKDLLEAKKQVTVLNDAISSRSLFDFSTAIGELRDAGARISSAETVIYEIVQDAKSPDFKALLPLIKTHA